MVDWEDLEVNTDTEVPVKPSDLPDMRAKKTFTELLTITKSKIVN